MMRIPNEWSTCGFNQRIGVHRVRYSNELSGSVSFEEIDLDHQDDSLMDGVGPPLSQIEIRDLNLSHEEFETGNVDIYNDADAALSMLHRERENFQKIALQVDQNAEGPDERDTLGILNVYRD